MVRRQRNSAGTRFACFCAIENPSGAVGNLYRIPHLLSSVYQHPSLRTVRDTNKRPCIRYPWCFRHFPGIPRVCRTRFDYIGRIVAEHNPRVNLRVIEYFATTTSPDSVKVSTDTLNYMASPVLHATVAGIIPFRTIIMIQTETPLPGMVIGHTVLFGITCVYRPRAAQGPIDLST